MEMTLTRQRREALKQNEQIERKKLRIGCIFWLFTVPYLHLEEVEASHKDRKRKMQ